MITRTVTFLIAFLLSASVYAATLADLARETSTTSGTGTITLNGASSGWLTFEEAASQLGKTIDGATVSYGLVNGSERESGRGVYTAATNTLTRCASACASTNGGSPISLSGTTTVAITAISEDFDDKQPLDSDLTSWAAVTRAAGFDTFTTTPSQANLFSLLTDETILVDADIGSTVQAYDSDLDTWAGVTPSANGQSLVAAADYAAMRALLDLEAGTDFYSITAADAAFQPIDADLTSWALITRAAGFDTFTTTPTAANFATLVTGESYGLTDAELAAIAGLTSAADRLPYFTGSGTASLATFTTSGRNLIDDASITAQRNTLGASGGVWPVTLGGTGRATSTTAYGLLAAGTTATGAHQTLAAGATTQILVGGGASALPVWTTATGSGAPVRATSPTLTTPALGTPSALVLTNATGLTTSGVLAGTLVTAAEGIAANDNDTTLPTSAAVKAYADSVSGLANIVEDTSPQLGGDLDANGFDILFDDGTGIADANGALALEFDTVASQDVWARIEPGVGPTTQGVKIYAETVGADADISLRAKGNGALDFYSNGGSHWFFGPNGGQGLVLNVTNSYGPTLALEFDATGYTNAQLGELLFFGQDASGNGQAMYASIDGIAADATNTSEDGELKFYTAVAGATYVDQMSIGNGVVVGARGSIPFPGQGNIAFDDAKGIFDSNGNEQFLFQETASAVNYLEITNAATSNRPVLAAAGGDSDVGVEFNVKGNPDPAYKFNLGAPTFGGIEWLSTTSGAFGFAERFWVDSASPAANDRITTKFYNGNNSADELISYVTEWIKADQVTDAGEQGEFYWTNYVAGSEILSIYVRDGVTLGGFPTADPGNGNLALDDGNGLFDHEGNEQLILQSTASAVNYVEITNAATGNNPSISAAGDDAVVGLSFSVKGNSNGLEGFTFNMGTGDYNEAVFRSSGTGHGPEVILLNDTSSPNVNDDIGSYQWQSNNSVASNTVYAAIGSHLLDATSTEEDGSFDVYTRVAGNVFTAPVLSVAGGVGFGNWLSSYANLLSIGSGNLGIQDDNGIYDGNGNEQLIFDQTASAAEYIIIRNGVNRPTIASSHAGGELDFEAAVFRQFDDNANTMFWYQWTDSVGTFDNAWDGFTITTYRAYVGSAQQQIAERRIVAVSDNSGAETGRFDYRPDLSGTATTSLMIGDGVVVGSDTTMPGWGNLSFADAKGVFDGNGNEWLIFQETVSAVNYLEITNSATGNPPILSAAGTNTDIDLSLLGKGTGGVNIADFRTPVSAELTIATGAITATGSFHTVDTESDGATDDLETINGGADGQVLRIIAADSGRTVVAKDGTGNLQLSGDCTLDNAQDVLTLIYAAAQSAWLGVSCSDNGA